MLCENLKSARKSKVLTQDELAVRLNVVRQTISKWEKGLSVPDAEMLIKIAEILEVSVGELLGEKIENETNRNDIAEQLSRINEQLAIKNRRSKTILKVILGFIIAVVVINVFLIIISMISFNSFENNTVIEQQSEIIVPED